MDGTSGQQAGTTRHESRIAGARRRVPSDHGAHLLDHLSVISKYRRVALSVFLLVVLGSLMRTYTTTPLYRAQARLAIEVEEERTTAMGSAISSSTSLYWRDPKVFQETQYRILTGSELARRVVRRLDLGRVPEFNGADPPTPRLNRMLSALSPTPSGTDAEATVPSESTLINRLLAQVSVVPVQNSHLVDVAFVSADPVFAVRAVDTLADEYVQQNMELRRTNIVASLEWLSQELERQQKKVEVSERAMTQYREDQNALSLEERQNIVVARLNQLNDAVTKAKTSRVQKEAVYDQINTLGVDVSADTIPAILQNPYIQTIKTRLAELQREKVTLMERYGEKYPDVMKVNASLQDVSGQLQTELAKAIEAIRNDYKSALAEERTLADALEEQKAAAMDLNRKSVGYTVLEREAHSNRQLYEALLLREKELQVLANSRGSNVRVTDRALPPGAPFTPTPWRNLMLASAAGLALSLGVVFLLDYLDDTVKNPDDVTDKLNLPLLGLVPKVSGVGGLLLSHEVADKFGEAFRSLRTSVAFGSGRESTRLVMVTSAQPLEGKTTTACNLALALAMGESRVLLIDADLRRPGVHRTMMIDNGTGLSNVLSGQTTIRNAVVALENPRIWVMTAGTPPPNPSELLGSDAMRTLFDEMKKGQGFDWVIIDTPPVLPVTDAVVLSPLVDGIAFVIGSEMTQRRHVARVLETLTASGAHLLGAVLNRVDLKRNRYYYSRYYGYREQDDYVRPPAA